MNTGLKWFRRRVWRCGVPAGLVCLGTVGCAIKTTHLTIRQWPMESRALYYQQPAPYRLVVLPLLDQRPEVERKGQKAPGMFLLLWNRRVGDYYTSDTVFGGAVPQQLGEQLATYLRSANVFTDVQYAQMPLEPLALQRPFFLQQVGQQHNADYLFGGELEHFFGSQHQEFSMFVLPLYFVNAWGWQNGKTLPWGQATVTAYLFDGRSGALLWRRRVDHAETLPREHDSMAQAALEAFTGAAGELATELRQLPFDSLASGNIAHDSSSTP